MEIEAEIDGWPGDDWLSLAQRCVHAVCHDNVELANPRLILSLLFTSDEQVHALNREWRQRDKPTNVLSFPMLEREELVHADPADGPPILLGDIALAYGTCQQEADAKGRSLAEHAAHLIVHGLLHLAGHDHETGSAQAEAMEALEVKALAHLGIADPYS